MQQAAAQIRRSPLMCLIQGGMPLKEIKVKPEDRKPKLMNETARVPKTAMKDLWLKSKEKSVIELKETPFASQRGESSNDPANNAGNQMLSGTETTVKRGAELTYRGGKNLVQTTARIIKEKREIQQLCGYVNQHFDRFQL